MSKALLNLDINCVNKNTSQSCNPGKEIDLNEVTLDLAQSNCASHLSTPTSKRNFCRIGFLFLAICI